MAGKENSSRVVSWDFPGLFYERGLHLANFSLNSDLIRRACFFPFARRTQRPKVSEGPNLQTVLIKA